jgi:hypothetical protein
VVRPKKRIVRCRSRLVREPWLPACIHAENHFLFGMNRGKKPKQRQMHARMTADLKTSPAAEDETSQRGDVEVIAPFLIQYFRERSVRARRRKSNNMNPFVIQTFAESHHDRMLCTSWARLLEKSRKQDRQNYMVA